MKQNESMTIIEFLEARIAEDEKLASYYGPLAMGTARVLAECAAKRAIIDEYTGSPATFQIMAHMAAVYAYHPDYRQEWAS